MSNESSAVMADVTKAEQPISTSMDTDTPSPSVTRFVDTKETKPPTDGENRSLFVGSYSCARKREVDLLKSVCEERYGVVVAVRPLSKYAFVEFADSESVEKALAAYEADPTAQHIEGNDILGTLHFERVRAGQTPKDQTEKADTHKRKLSRRAEKNKEKRAKKTKLMPCFEFREKGECKYGAECAFGHIPGPTAEEKGRTLIRTQVDKRIVLHCEGEDSLDANGLAVPMNPVDRYFSKMYAVQEAETSEDVYIYMHSNKLVVIGIADCHPAAQSDKRHVVKVDFDTSKRLSSNANKVSGKKKKNAESLTPVDILCELQCSDGTFYTIRAAVPGKLIELNVRLETDPGAVTRLPSSLGFLAVIQVKLDRVARVTESLLSAAEYENVKAERIAGAAKSADTTEAAVVEMETTTTAATEVETTTTAAEVVETTKTAAEVEMIQPVESS